MKNYKVWLLLALVFLAGFTGGVVVTRGVVRHFIRQALVDPDLIRGRVERELNRKLRLDRQQREQVHQILIGSRDRLQKLRQEFQPQFTEVIQDTRKQINAVLTPQQQEKFEQFQADNRAFLNEERR